MKKKLVIGVLAVGVLLGTAGCMSVPVINNTYEVNHKLKDGRSVVCLGHNGYGLSCDWGNAK